MKFFITFTKKKLFLALLILSGVLLIIFNVRASGNRFPDGSTNTLRMTYIESLGLSPDDSAVQSKSIILPSEFSDVYARYNDLQLKAGFDLSKYKGKEAVIYSYPLSEDRVVHLIVHKGRIIGGDIADTRVDGEMKPLF